MTMYKQKVHKAKSKREDDLAVFGLLVVTAQEVGD